MERDGGVSSLTQEACELGRSDLGQVIECTAFLIQQKWVHSPEELLLLPFSLRHMVVLPINLVRALFHGSRVVKSSVM